MVWPSLKQLHKRMCHLNAAFTFNEIQVIINDAFGIFSPALHEIVRQSSRMRV